MTNKGPARARRRPAKPPAKGSVAKTEDAERLPTKPETDSAAGGRTYGDIFHHRILGSVVYEEQLRGAGVGDDMVDAVRDNVAAVIRRLAPQDPLEEMLAAQILWLHGRLAQLSRMSGAAPTINHVRIINEAADRAANTFRRHMLALAEYRSSKRGGNRLSIGQANVAEQQIVTNIARVPARRENGQNEQGWHGDIEDQATLPADPEGPGESSGVGA